MDEMDDPEPPPESQNSAPDAALAIEPSGEEVETGTEVALDASESSDPDGDELSYSWALASVPDGSEASVESPQAAEASFTPDVEGFYEVGLEVSDGDATDSVGDELEAVVPAVVVNGNITENTTWTADNRYRVEDFSSRDVVEIKDGARLTIEAGTDVRFEEDAGLQLFGGGSIEANGTAEEPISLVGTSAERGWWRGIKIQSGDNVFSHVRIRHTGNTDVNEFSSGGAVRLDQISEEEINLTLEGSVLEESSGRGLVLESDLRDPPVGVSVTETEFAGIEGAEVDLPLSLVGRSSIKNDNEFSDGSVIRIEDGGQDLAGEKTVLPGRDATYYIDAPDEDIIPTNRLEIEPGADLVFEEGSGLSFGGAYTSGGNLIANGTSSEPITMTATEGNGQQGWWAGLTLIEDVDAEVRHVEIRDAGGDPSIGNENVGSIRLIDQSRSPDRGSIIIENSVIEKSGNHGVACESSGYEVVQSRNTFSEIAGENVSGCE